MLLHYGSGMTLDVPLGDQVKPKAPVGHVLRWTIITTLQFYRGISRSKNTGSFAASEWRKLRRLFLHKRKGRWRLKRRGQLGFYDRSSLATIAKAIETSAIRLETEAQAFREELRRLPRLPE